MVRIIEIHSPPSFPTYFFRTYRFPGVILAEAQYLHADPFSLRVSKRKGHQSTKQISDLFSHVLKRKERVLSGESIS